MVGIEPSLLAVIGQKMDYAILNPGGANPIQFRTCVVKQYAKAAQSFILPDLHEKPRRSLTSTLVHLDTISRHPSIYRKVKSPMGTIHKQSSESSSPVWSYPTVPITEYRTDASTGITKQVLLGMAEGTTDFIVRYFTIPPGGKSALDRHEHQHGVVITQGTGRVLLDEQWHPVSTGDAVFTDTNEIHQFEATGISPLGFICVIPRWAENDSCAVPTK